MTFQTIWHLLDTFPKTMPVQCQFMQKYASCCMFLNFSHCHNHRQNNHDWVWAATNFPISVIVTVTPDHCDQAVPALPTARGWEVEVMTNQRPGMRLSDQWEGGSVRWGESVNTLISSPLRLTAAVTHPPSQSWHSHHTGLSLVNQPVLALWLVRGPLPRGQKWHGKHINIRKGNMTKLPPSFLKCVDTPGSSALCWNVVGFIDYLKPVY